MKRWNMPLPEAPEQRSLPFHVATLLFGALSLPLAFARHLVSLAVVLALWGIVLGIAGRALVRRQPERYRPATVLRGLWGLRLAVIGLLLSVVVWILWMRGILPILPGK